MARPALSGPLWRHGDFLRLWSAQAVSAFGARITREGLPLAAVLTLDASPAQLGVLAALSMGPGLVVGLVSGGFVDRSKRRSILIWSDIVRAAVLTSAPLAAWVGWLTMTQLYVVAGAVGAAGVLFDLAHRAYLPGLIAREHLLEGNTKLGVSDSVAEVGGPALAGLLFQLFTAPFAILLNAGTYLVSAAFLGLIRTPEAPVERSSEREHLGQDLAHGLRIVLERPMVRPLLLMTVTGALFGSFFAGLYVLFALRTLGMRPDLLGLTIAAGGIGAIFGAALAAPITRWLGVGPAIIACGLISGGSAFLIPLAPAHSALGVACMMGAQLIGDAFAVAAIIPAVTLQQAMIPHASLGRAGAIFHVARGAMAVIGALAGGWLAVALGVRETLLLACLGGIAAPLIALASPLRTLRTLD